VMSCYFERADFREAWLSMLKLADFSEIWSGSLSCCCSLWVDASRHGQRSMHSGSLCIAPDKFFSPFSSFKCWFVFLLMIGFS
jgi:hypothetical protein